MLSLDAKLSCWTDFWYFFFSISSELSREIILIIIFGRKVFSSFVTVGSGPFLTYSGKLIYTRKSNSASMPSL